MYANDVRHEKLLMPGQGQPHKTIPTSIGTVHGDARYRAIVFHLHYTPDATGHSQSENGLQSLTEAGAAAISYKRTGISAFVLAR